MPFSKRRRVLGSKRSPLYDKQDRHLGVMAGAQLAFPPAHLEFTPSAMAAETGRDMMAVGAGPLDNDEYLAAIELSIPAQLSGSPPGMESSPLGSRFLTKRAAAYGIEKHNGAEHLAKNFVGDGNRKAFVALLKNAEDLDDQATTMATLRIFTVALDALRRSECNHTTL